MKKQVLVLSVLIFVILTTPSLQAQEIALQLYSLREQMKADVKGSHQLVSDWGIKYLEGGGTYGMELDEYKNFLQSVNLSMIAVGADYDKLKENPQEIIDNAKAYGAKYATCFWIPHTSGNFSFKEAEEAVTLFNKTGKLFKDAGIILTYHPHGYEFKTHGDGFLFDSNSA